MSSRRGRLGWINIRLKELRRLLRHRGMRGPDILIDEAIQAVSRGALTSSSQEVGKDLQVTFAEKLLLRLNTITACDKTKEEATAIFSERRRERDRIRARTKRAAENQRRERSSDLDVRAEAVWSMLTTARFATVAQLATAVEECRAFYGMDGRKLSPSSTRRAIQRAVHHLNAAALIEVRKVTGTRAQPILLVRKRAVVVAIGKSVRRRDLVSAKP